MIPYKPSKPILPPFFTSRPFFVCFTIALVVIFGSVVINHRASSQPELEAPLAELPVVDEKYGVVIGSDEYFKHGKFIEHGLDLIPDFDPHRA